MKTWGNLKKTLLAASALALTLPLAAQAGTVDLSSWIENGFKGNNGAGTWNVQGVNNNSVLQTRNGDPTVFFKPGANAQGTALKGSIKVETTGDDDFIGFVLGYQDGELNSANADFWLIDWKQGNQSGAARGLALSHVMGDIQGGPAAGSTFWPHSGYVSEVQRATNLGDTGWADNTEYEFELVFTSSLIEVFVDGVKELSYAGSFTDGAFGFYNYSQPNVRYAEITDQVIPPSPVPLPASLPILVGGLAGLGLLRRRRKS